MFQAKKDKEVETTEEIPTVPIIENADAVI